MRAISVVTLLFSFLLFLSGSVIADVYVWTDKDGVIHFSEQPPPKVLAKSRHTVELYTTSWCKYSQQAKRFFRTRGIPFKEYDIEIDKTAAKRKKKLDPQPGVPFAVVNGFGIHGYSPTQYQNALQVRE